jgi:hypothetical protein
MDTSKEARYIVLVEGVCILKVDLLIF